ncbi:hypothetical protein Zmor_005178 [Zophobas morio]|uniref:Uncharacterized protein n=1 Tax=Zophobas morio TaxID=2755281 RepID=A0AA38MM22_9CUCU|nr:hypothetical protein Zmor_005178 [Zophobas morio]
MLEIAQGLFPEDRIPEKTHVALTKEQTEELWRIMNYALKKGKIPSEWKVAKFVGTLGETDKTQEKRHIVIHLPLECLEQTTRIPDYH